MKKVSLLVYEDAVLVAVSAVMDLLTGTNRLLQETGRPAAFDLELLGEERSIRMRQPAQFHCHRMIEEADQTDLVIIPSFMGEPEMIGRKYSELVEWIGRMHRRGSEVASLCLGSYFLAEAGLLDGKPCTSHWKAIEDMRVRYPMVQLMPDVIVTDQRGIYTSGGAFSSIHVVLYLVEKFCGREVAIAISKNFSIDLHRPGQAHFAVFRGQRDHHDEEIHTIQEWIDRNFREKLTVGQMAGHVHMSRRNFIRRFKKATGNTPLEYLQRMKVEASKKALENGNEPIGSLIYDVGYNDEKTFRSIFKRYTGITPQEYRRRYSRVAVNGRNELSGSVE